MMCLQLDTTAMGRVYILTETGIVRISFVPEDQNVLYSVGTFPLHCHMMTHPEVDAL